MLREAVAQCLVIAATYPKTGRLGTSQMIKQLRSALRVTHPLLG